MGVVAVHKPESIERNGVEDFYSVIMVAVNRLRTQGCGGFRNVDTTRRFRIEVLAATPKGILRTVEEIRP